MTRQTTVTSSTPRHHQTQRSEAGGQHCVSMYEQPACTTCKYKQHCSGQRDAVTGAVNSEPDVCPAFEVYSGRAYGGWPVEEQQVPYRVSYNLLRLKIAEV